MDKLNMYITFIIFIKVCFVILAISHLYLKITHKDDSKTDKTIVFWKERLEFIFVILMAALLIYLFKPDSNRDMLITHETKILLYLFGFILLITADWKVFIHESPFYKILQKIV
jgi:L-asparagine transporter-like permease